MVYTYGTAVIPEDKLPEIIKSTYSFKPAAMIQYLELQRPIFKKISGFYGHFGRTDPDFTWEYISKIDASAKRPAQRAAPSAPSSAAGRRTLKLNEEPHALRCWGKI